MLWTCLSEILHLHAAKYMCLKQHQWQRFISLLSSGLKENMGMQVKIRPVSDLLTEVNIIISNSGQDL